MHIVIPVGADDGEKMTRAAQVMRVALQKADALGVLARTNQVVTKIGVVAFAQHIDFHQSATNKVNRHRADEGVDNHRPKHIVGDVNRVAEYGGVQIAGQLQHGFGIFVHRQRGQIKTKKQSDRHISQAV